MKKVTSKTLARLQAIYKGLKVRIVQLVTQLGNVVKFVFRLIFQPLMDVSKAFSPGGTINKIFQGIRKFFKMFSKVFQAFGRVFARLAAFIIAPIMGIMKAMEEFENQDGGMIAKSVAALIGFFTGFLDFMFVSLADLVKSAISWIVEKIFGKDNPFSKFLDSFSFSDLFNNLMSAIKDFIIGIPKYLEDAFKKGGGTEIGMLGVLLKDYKEMVTNLLGFAGELLGKAFTFVIDKLGITDFLKNFKTTFVKYLEDAWTALKNVFSTAFDYVMEKLGIDFDSQELVTIVSDWWDDLMKSFKDKLGAAWDGIKTFLGVDNTPTSVSGKNADALYEKKGAFRFE